MDALEFRLLNDYQRDFPLHARPYETVARTLGRSEVEVLDTLARLKASGTLSRIGATFAPGRIGAATLAAMRVPAQRVEEIARLVNAFPEVNHNYEREHAYNLWFVVTAPDRERVEAVVRAIESGAACGPVLSLPMVEPYHVDLGFDLAQREPVAARKATRAPGARRVALTPRESAVIGALQEGLALVPEPYAELARRAGMPEREAVAVIARCIEDGVINRLGVIVRHRQLGFRANAMVVWDVPDDEVAASGERMARHPEVTLCYRRERSLPAWRYNLYCMIHGRTHAEVIAQVAGVDTRCDLGRYPHEVLFSRRCFKQRGARYVGGVARG